MSQKIEYSPEDKLILIQSRLDVCLWQHWRIELYSRDVLAKEKLIATLGVENCSLTTGKQYGRDIPVLRIKGEICFAPLEEGAIRLARFFDEGGDCLFQCDVVPSSVRRLDCCIVMHPTNTVKRGDPIALQEMSISLEAITIPERWIES